MSKLRVQLSLAFLLLLLLVVGGMALAINLSLDTRFRSYLAQESNSQMAASLNDRLAKFYRESGTWAGVAAIMPSPGGGGQGAGRNNDSGAGAGGINAILVDPSGTVVFARDSALIGVTADDATLAAAAPVTVDGEVVAYLVAQSPGQASLSIAQAAFLSDVRNILLAVGGVALVLALLTALGLSELLTRPLQRLSRAAGRIAAGELGVTVGAPPTAAEELRELAAAFDQMSLSLAESEAQRQRMTADIAHELRTPVSVIRGQLQAMLDGVTEPDTATIAVAYDQAIHLGRLVEDLRTLTRAESGNLPLDRQPIDLLSLLQQTATAFAPLADDAGHPLHTDLPDVLPLVAADADRLRQVLGNLLTNALRYTTPGGAIRLSAVALDDSLRIAVSNDGVMLTPDEATHVFERFYRADTSRQRESGGSGLGLAISQQLVRLHGGRIRVELAGEQTRFIVELPRHTASA